MFPPIFPTSRVVILAQPRFLISSSSPRSSATSNFNLSRASSDSGSTGRLSALVCTTSSACIVSLILKHYGVTFYQTLTDLYKKKTKEHSSRIVLGFQSVTKFTMETILHPCRSIIFLKEKLTRSIFILKASIVMP